MATSFFSRWSQRKLQPEQESKQDLKQEQPQDAEAAELNESQALSEETQELESSTPDSFEAADDLAESALIEEVGVAELLVSEAEASVKKAALRKLFLSEEFNQLDGLNDYDHDYSKVKPLAADVASKLRDWINQPEEEEPSEDSITEASKAEEDLQEDNALEAESSLETESALETLDDSAQDSQSETEIKVGQNIPHE